MWTQTVSLSIVELSKNKSENCPILCLSNVRPAWDMFTLHNKKTVPTQKHLGSNGTSMGQGIVSRTLKTVHWLVLWVERDKDNVNKSTLFRKRTVKLETTHFHWRVGRSNLHRDISARRSNVETHLCDRKMPCSTHQTHDDSEFRTSSRSLRSSSQKADTQQTWCQNWQNLSLDRFIYSLTVITVSSQERTSVCCQQGSRNTGKLFHGSMETCQRRWKPSGYWHKRDVHRRPQVWLNGPAWLQTDEEKWPKPLCQLS